MFFFMRSRADIIADTSFSEIYVNAWYEIQFRLLRRRKLKSTPSDKPKSLIESRSLASHQWVGFRKVMQWVTQSANKLLSHVLYVLILHLLSIYLHQASSSSSLCSHFQTSWTFTSSMSWAATSCSRWITVASRVRSRSCIRRTGSSTHSTTRRFAEMKSVSN